MCANRIYVQEGVLQAFSDKLREASAPFQVGAGVDDGVTIGPLIERARASRRWSNTSAMPSPRARALAGGKRHALGGNFFEPTLLSGVTPDMKIANEETFGPVAPLFPFKTVDDVLRMANSTEYGLAGTSTAAIGARFPRG